MFSSLFGEKKKGAISLFIYFVFWPLSSFYIERGQNLGRFVDGGGWNEYYTKILCIYIYVVEEK